MDIFIGPGLYLGLIFVLAGLVIPLILGTLVYIYYYIRYGIQKQTNAGDLKTRKY